MKCVSKVFEQNEPPEQFWFYMSIFILIKGAVVFFFLLIEKNENNYVEIMKNNSSCHCLKTTEFQFGDLPSGPECLFLFGQAYCQSFL